jgi:hypothetical protein
MLCFREAKYQTQNFTDSWFQVPSSFFWILKSLFEVGRGKNTNIIVQQESEIPPVGPGREREEDS